MTMSSDGIARIADEAAAVFVVGPDDVLAIRLFDETGLDELETLEKMLRQRIGSRFILLAGDGAQVGVIRGGVGHGVSVDD